MKYLFTIIASILIVSCSNQKRDLSIKDEPLNTDTISLDAEIKNVTDSFVNNSINFIHLDSTLFKNTVYSDLQEIVYFNGYENAGGTMIDSINNQEYTLSHYKKEDIHLIVFEQIVRIDDQKVKYTALDMIEITGLLDNQYLSYGLCRKDEKFDSEIISVFIRSDEEYHGGILKSWRANRQTGNIYEIETDNIDCVNEGYGI